MADTHAYRNPSPPDGADGLEETLGRLSKKAGVKATIVLDRVSGAILKTSGQISSIRISSSSSQAAANNNSISSPTGNGPSQAPGSFSTTETDTALNESQGAEHLAVMVWSFVTAAGTLVQDIDAEDELRLLRLRTKKQELVVVPDPKYLLIVIHEVPTA